MNKSVTKYLLGSLSITLLVYYLILSWILHRSGYEHSENLFIAEKIKILFDSSENNLVTLGTTFPTLVYLISLIFTPFGYLYAPILASISLTVILFFTIINDFKKTSILPPIVYIPFVALLFFLHPGIIYCAISGRGVAGILLFFYFLFRSLFRFYKTQTTFYLSMASIFLTCLVFCDFNFIWLLLAFFPFIVSVSLEGLKINKDQTPVSQYFESLNNVSQRRKLTNRAVAIYIILFLLPIGALFLFSYLNRTHAGDAYYFMHSQYANWHVIGNTPIGELLANQIIKGTNAANQTQIIFQFYLLLLSPILVLSLLYFKGKLYELLTIAAPFVLIGILIINTQYYFTIEYYLIFIILGLIVLCFYAKNRFSRLFTSFVFIFIAVLNVYTGIYCFKKTDDYEEKHFFSVLRHSKEWFSSKSQNEEFEVANYISKIADLNNKVLIDDAAAFGIVAHLKSLEGIELPVNKSFGTIVENPIVGAKYMCVASLNNRYRNFTVLNAYNLGQMEEKGKFTSQLIFQTNNWSVYKLFPVDDF
jgi:hypothetical protein